MLPDLMSFNCGAGSAGSTKKLHTDYRGPVLLRAGRRVVPRNRPAGGIGPSAPAGRARTRRKRVLSRSLRNFVAPFSSGFSDPRKGPSTSADTALVPPRARSPRRPRHEAARRLTRVAPKPFSRVSSWPTLSKLLPRPRGDLFSLVTTRHVLPCNTWPCLHFARPTARAYALHAHACYLDAAAVYYFKVDDGEPVLSVAPCIV